MDPKVQQAISYFSTASKMNPNDPASLEKLKQMYAKATNLKSSPNYAKYPVELRTVIDNAHQNLSAIPQITGLKTQVQGNKWEAKIPTRPPLGIKRRCW